MKKTLFLLISGGAFSIAQAASVFVDVYRDGPGRDGMNQYTSNAAVGGRFRKRYSLHA